MGQHGGRHAERGSYFDVLAGEGRGVRARGYGPQYRSLSYPCTYKTIMAGYVNGGAQRRVGTSVDLPYFGVLSPIYCPRDCGGPQHGGRSDDEHGRGDREDGMINGRVREEEVLACLSPPLTGATGVTREIY
jgi:hypothetical protein